ncbi:MAG: hypothetical protein F4Z31_10625 [Gemmatimonadetes bacterium]|nr:hypothetical protein [Gemmatimonadota bacterium]MYE95003.1 hypothetical protein [Gemmatimonadota bacterium]MYJ09840.1 hypothetical protein [Gemmatimonadota bacterium]
MDDLARARYAAESKSRADAYIFWFLLAPLGAHRIYLAKYDGLAQPVLLATGLFLVLRDEAGSGVGTFLIACGLLWLFADAFLIPGMVRGYNRRLERSLTRDQPG